MAGLSRAQQQTVFTNILLNQYLYNPAYAGVDTGTTFTGAYRNQWVGFEGAPKTYVINGYGNFKKRPNMTAGGLVSTERMGLLQRTAFYGSYAYKLKINSKYAISFGLSAGAVQYSFKGYDARPYDADDKFLESPTANGMAFDANAGFYFYSKKFFLGASDQQMPNSKIHWSNTQGKLTNHFYAYTGYNFNLDKKSEWIIQPSILARLNNPSPYQLEYNLKLMYKSMIWLGASYRERSSLGGLLGVKIDNRFTFGYGYDFTLSKLSNYSSGSHEIVLSYNIPFRKKKSKSEKEQAADEEELNKIDNTLKTNLRKKESDKNVPTPKEETEEKPGSGNKDSDNSGDGKRNKKKNKSGVKEKDDNRAIDAPEQKKPAKKKTAKKKKYKKKKNSAYKKKKKTKEKNSDE